MTMAMVTMDAGDASETRTKFDIKQRAHLLELFDLLGTQYLIVTAVHHRLGRQQTEQESIAGVSRL
jgi:hypothetical protein